MDQAGYSVSSAGDVNGDGKNDLIIGTSNARGSAGQAYVVFGKSSFSPPLELSTLNGSNGFIMNGIAVRDWARISVSSAGDINGDGIDDLIIGAQLAASSSRSATGQAYVVFWSIIFYSPLELSTLNGSNGFIINGIAAGNLAGYSVSSAGDINGDGSNGFIINGIADYDFAGSSVSLVGDINGDGRDDLLIGAPGADPDSKTVAGQALHSLF
ncbi:MAG: integrin alpha [Candidatus Midichloria sp.]|nr:integrin alpha [Candidatus Midichloria sp.]